MHVVILSLALIGLILILTALFVPSLPLLFGSSQQLSTNIILFGIGIVFLIPLPFAGKRMR